VKHLSCAPLEGKLLASTTNIRLGWEGLPGTNVLAYCKHLYITVVKSFMTLVAALEIEEDDDVFPDLSDQKMKKSEN
jgi:hypothetical protein